MQCAMNQAVSRNLNIILGNPLNMAGTRSNSHLLRNKVIKVVLPLLAIVTKYPFTHVCDGLFKEIAHLHSVLSGANYIAYAILIWSASRAMLSNILESEDPLIQELEGAYLTTFEKRMVQIAALVTDIAAQVPIGFLVKASTGSTLSEALLIGCDPWITAISSFIGYESLIRFIRVPRIQEAKSLKTIFCNKLEVAKANILRSSHQTQKQFIKDIMANFSKANGMNFSGVLSTINTYDTQYFQIPCARDLPCVTNMLSAVGLLLLVGEFAMMTSAAVTGARHLYDNDPFIVSCAIVVLLAFAQVLGKSVVVGTVDAGIGALNIIRGRDDYTAMQRIHPKQSIILRVFLLAIAALSWGPVYSVCITNYQDPLSQIFGVSSSLAIVVLSSVYATDVVESAAWQFHANKEGTPSHTAYKIEQVFNVLTELTQKASDHQFLQFKDFIPQSNQQTAVAHEEGYLELTDGARV